MSNVADQQKIRQVVADAQKKGVPEFDLITEADVETVPLRKFEVM